MKFWITSGGCCFAISTCCSMDFGSCCTAPDGSGGPSIIFGDGPLPLSSTICWRTCAPSSCGDITFMAPAGGGAVWPGAGRPRWARVSVRISSTGPRAGSGGGAGRALSKVCTGALAALIHPFDSMFLTESRYGRVACVVRPLGSTMSITVPFSPTSRNMTFAPLGTPGNRSAVNCWPSAAVPAPACVPSGISAGAFCTVGGCGGFSALTALLRGGFCRGPFWRSCAPAARAAAAPSGSRTGSGGGGGLCWFRIASQGFVT